MSLQTYRTRSTLVAAIQFDGGNLEEINQLLIAAKRTPLADLLEVGAWVTFTDTSFQVLPNSAFQRIYEPVETVTTHDGYQYELPIDRPVVDTLERTCYRCANYAMTNGGVGFCTLFNEQIDSEVHAAADCSGYEPEGS